MKVINILLTLAILLSTTTLIFSQCAYNNTFYAAVNPPTPGSTATNACVFGGDRITVNVTAGQTYIFSLCSNGGTGDSQITLYNTAGTVVLGYNDDFCGLYSEITWVATFTGSLNVLIDEYNCVNGFTCMILNVTWVGAILPPNCTNNDDCTTAQVLTLSPSGNPGSAACLVDCNTGASPGIDFIGNVCEDMLGPTVWYTFTTDAGAATLNVNLTSSAFATPEFTMFTNSCGPWTLLNGGCVEGTAGVANATVQISANTTYIIAVSDVGGGSGNFNLCMTQNIDNSLCNTNDNLVEVSSSDPTTPVGGPYSPGESVNFCYNILQFSKENCNWLQGIVPTFGDCWSPASFNAQGMPITSTPPAIAGSATGSWGWYPAGAVQYNNIIGSLPPNSPLPGGWFFQCNNCGVSNPDPDLSWGDGKNILAVNDCDPAGNGYTWQVCFTLIAGPLNNCTNGTTDCGIFMKTYADGEIGGWTDIGCVGDLPYSYSAAFACCAGLQLDSITAPACNGLNTGAIHLTTIGDINVVYGYTWSTGATTEDLSGLAAGIYGVTLTDSVNNCTFPLSITVTQPSAVTASISSSTSVTCNGLANGTATANGTGGTGTKTYIWSNGRTTALNTGLAAGAYCVTVSDANNCTASTCVTITQPSVVTATITSSTSVSCNGGANGTATASGTGGTGTKTYVWSNGRTTALNTGLAAGVHCVTVSDANLCRATACVTITQPSAVTASIPSSTSATCNVGGTATAAGAGGTGAYTYLWTNAQTTIMTTGLSAGTHTVTVSDANSCTSTANVTITQPSTITATITSSTSVTCNGLCNGSATVTASGGTGGYTYLWNNGVTTTTNTGLCAATYTVTITDLSSCTVSASVTITQPTAVTATISSSSSVTCNGLCNGSATAAGSGGTAGYSFIWSNGQTTPVNTGLCSATYTVTVTDANLCTATTTVTITQPSAVTATISSSTSVSCNGGSNGSATASGSGGTGAYTYAWNNGRTTASNTGLIAGIYCVTVSDVNLCTATACVTITQPSAVTATIPSSTSVTCNGGSSGSATAAGSGGTGVYTYVWNNGRTTASNTGLIAGTYCVTVSDANLCTATACVTITQPSAVTATIPSSTSVTCNGVCDGSATAAGLGGQGGAYTFVWSNAATTASNTGLCAAAYTVTVSDANGCVATTNVTISEPSAVTASLVSSTNASCNGVCNGDATVAGSGGSGPYTYLWSNAVTTASNTGLCTGNYTVTISDVNACTATTSISITEPTPVTASIPSFTIATCNMNNGSATAAGSGGTGGYTYEWSNGSTAITTTGLAAGSYIVTVSDANDCTDTASVNITQPGAVIVTIDSVYDASCVGATNGSIITIGSGGTGPYTYLWPNGSTDRNVTGLGAGTYIVTITDFNSCTSIASGTINNLPGLALTSNIIQPLCNGNTDGCVAIAVANGTGNYSYNWSTVGFSIDSICGFGAGTYTVTVTDTVGTTNLTGGIDTVYFETFEGTHNWNLSVSTGANSATPNVWAVNDTESGIAPPGCGTGGTGDKTLHITCTNFLCGTLITGAAYDASETSNTRAESPAFSTVGSSNITMTFDYIANGEGLLDNASLLYNDGIGGWQVLDPSLKTVICVGGQGQWTAYSIALPASCDNRPAVQLAFNWTNNNNAGTDPSVAINNILLTSSMVGGTIPQVCSAIDTFTLINPAVVAIAIDATTPANCNGTATGTATVSSTGGTGTHTYLWSTGATTATATGLAASMTHVVTVTDANGCSMTQNVTVSEPSVLTVMIDSVTNPSCNATLDGAVYITATGGITTAAYSYLWSPGGAITRNVTGIASGTYTVTVTDFNGCTATADTSIAAPGAVVVSATSTNVSCNGGSNGTATASGTSGSGPYTFVWSNGLTTPSITGLTAGSYIVTISDLNNCTDTTMVVITAPALLTVSTTSTGVTCANTTSGIITANAVGGTGSYTYTWSGAASGQGMVATGLASGSYDVTVTDANGCTATANTVIAPVVFLDSTTVPLTTVVGALDCDLNPIGELTITPVSGTGYTYLWSNGATDATASGLAAGTYTVTITNGSGCTVTQTGTVTAPLVPTVNPFINNIGVTSETVGTDESVNIDGGNDQSGQGVTYVWTTSSSDVVFGNNTNHTTTAISGEAGVYTLMITATSGACTDTGSVTLTVEDEFVGIPNAFSPGNSDKDGNNLFRPVGLRADQIEIFKVFNRWGELIYDGSDLPGDGWDGKYMNVEQPSDVYIYLLQYKLGNTDPIIVRGEVTLLR